MELIFYIGLIIFLTVSPTLVIRLEQEKKDRCRYQNLSDKYYRELNYNKNLVKDLKEENSRLSKLSKYQEIEDVKKEVKSIRDKASAKIEQAEQYLKDCSSHYNEIINSARIKAKEIMDKAEVDLNNAVSVKEMADSLLNQISGYDRYIIPEYSLFDDLAEKFSYEDGDYNRQLKIARKRTKEILNEHKAVLSNYRDIYSRNVVGSFFLEYFNQQVDIIIKQVKIQNFGILRQKIEDLYNRINQIGNILKTVISVDYVNARLDELHWVSLLSIENEKRLEQIKELKAAKADSEKKIKANEKKIRVNSEKIQSLELEIRDIEDFDEKEKLRQMIIKLTEENKDLKTTVDRQKSRQELGFTDGFVYIASNKGSYGENIYKIGVTLREEWAARIKELYSAGVPFPFDVHGLIYSNNAYKLEKELHNYFVLNRLNKSNKSKEFFKVNLSDIKKYLDDNGIQIYEKESWKWENEVVSEELRETAEVNEKIEHDSKYKDIYIKNWTEQYVERKVLDLESLAEEALSE